MALGTIRVHPFFLTEGLAMESESVRALRQNKTAIALQTTKEMAQAVWGERSDIHDTCECTLQVVEATLVRLRVPLVPWHEIVPVEF